MDRLTIGILAMVVFLAMVGFTPSAFAQVATNPAVTDSTKIQVPDVPITPVKSNPRIDLQGLRMGQKSEERSRTHIGPVEFESRPITVAAPWQPYQEPYQQWTPFFQRAHTDFSWSFYLHWKPQ